MKLSSWGIIYMCAFFLTTPVVGEWWVDSALYILYGFSTIGLLLFVITLRREIYISLPDIFLGSLLLYNLPAIIKTESLPTICLFAIIYLLTKGICREKNAINILVNAFIISGVIQVLVCLLQMMGYWESNDPYFLITGTFNNPGLLGGYLSVCLVATLGQYKHMNKGLVCFFIVLLITGLVLSNSRAAWLGVLAILLYKLMKYLKLSLWKQALYFGVLVIFVALFSLYFYKSTSVNGRLMIWKVCGMMVKDRPITGHGFAQFSYHYMHYQTKYIEQRKDAKENILLVNNQYAFNELLHITCEQGVLGLLIVLSLIVFLIKVHYKSPIENSLFLCFITYLIFSFFSYPCDDFTMLMLLAFIIGGLSASVPPITHTQSRYFKWGVYITIFIIIATLGKDFYNKLRIEKALSDYMYEDEYESFDLLQKEFSSFNNSKELVCRYARVLYLKGEYEAGVSIQEQAVKLYPTTDKYCDLGEMYHAIGDVVRAEQSYKYASQMLPHLIYPNLHNS